MQREILHKSMGNNDISVDTELLKLLLISYSFCIWPHPRLVSLRFNVRKLWMDK